MMSRDLPARPNLEHLKRQARNLLRDYEQGDPAAIERFRTLGAKPGDSPEPETPKLADAQHLVAQEYGFTTWPQLKAHVDALDQPFDPVAALHTAGRANDPARVRQLLDQYPALKARLNDPLPGAAFGATPLLAVLPWGNREMIDVLLAAGANINQKSHWWAGGFGVLDDDRGLAPFLIERGAIVDVHAAAKLGMMERLDALIVANPELVHARGGDGQTPLHVAPTVEVAQYLLDHDADINAVDVDHESTPAQYMIRDRQPVARYLVSRGCRTDILMAAALGDIDLVRHYLDTDPASIRTSVSEQYFPKRDPRAGGSIYIWTLGGNKTAHVVAREFRHEDVFDLLMSRSSDELKLALACELGDESVFKTLLARHPNLVITLSGEERRKLVVAAQNNNAKAVELMLSAGWPVDVKGDHGGAALHWAAWHGNAEMVREILKYHPALEARSDQFDLTPLGWALHGSENGWHKDTGDYAGTVDALLAAGAKAPVLTDDLEASAPVRGVLRRYAERARAR
jgi:ankyrin repeat protein